MSRAFRRGLSRVLVLLIAVVGCSLALDRRQDEWQARELRNHPLVGTIWDTAARQSIRRDTFLERLAGNPFILLGDKHDNPDHHRLQASILSELVARGRRPAVAFEPITADRSQALAAVLASASPTSEQVIDAVARRDQGWEWPLYAPVVEEALHAGLPIVAADLDPKWVRGLQAHGITGLDPQLTTRLGLADARLPPAGRARLADDIRQSHCGHATDAMVDRMIEAQQARDAHLARALLDHASEGAVLIAGNEHVRRDFGVPLYLARWAPSAPVVSVGLFEVSPGNETPGAAFVYESDGTSPFDYVWFTPRVDLVDPCERFREVLQQMREGGTPHEGREEAPGRLVP